jgi:cytidylate kinase
MTHPTNPPEADAPKTGLVVAVDGPAASGKSTVSRTLATRLGLPYVNTGLMYRALAARALSSGTDPEDGPALRALALAIRFALSPDGVRELTVEGGPPGPDLSSPRVEAIVSAVSRHPPVRAVMREAQRRLGAPGAVMEGRDIGSVVFPDADAKLFVWADPQVRVRRRSEERGDGEETEEMARALARRDALDAETNPPVPALGAVVLDTTTLSPDEAVERALRVVREALARPLGAAPGG